MNKPTIRKSSPDPFYLKDELISLSGIPLNYMTPWMREGNVSLGSKRRNRDWQMEEGNCEHNFRNYTYISWPQTPDLFFFFFPASPPPTTSRHILQNQHRTESSPFSLSTLNLSSAVIFFLSNSIIKIILIISTSKYSYFKFLSIFSTT